MKNALQTTLDLTEGDEISGFIPKNTTEGKRVRVITNDCPEDIQAFRWGLISEKSWNMRIGGGNLNARIETLEDKSTFAESVDNRCLILVDGFYERKHLSKFDRLKHLIYTSDGIPFAFAGIWREGVAPNGEVVQSCAIVTTKARGIMIDIHNNPETEPRMPVILKSGEEFDWLTMDLNKFRDELDKRLNVDLIAVPLRDYQGSLF